VGFVILLLGLANLVRFGGALWNAANLPDLPMATTSWAYRAATGAVWGVAFVTCTVGMTSFRSHWRWATLGVVTLYQVHVWANHLLLDANDDIRRAWPFHLVLTLVLLVYVWGVLNLPGVRKEFKR
jgi:hypothetical protein